MSDNFSTLVAEVKERADIVDVCQLLGIELTTSGGRAKALCPFHSENTPSFIVDENMGTFHCFGCGARGDVISLVQELNNTDFFDSVRIIANNAGMSDIDARIAAVHGGENDSGVDYKTLRECVSLAARFYARAFRHLDDSHPAVRMVTDRKLPRDGGRERINNSDNPHEKPMYLGYAGEKSTEIIDFLRSRGFSIDTIVDSGLARKIKTEDGVKFFDFFSNRLLFSFSDSSGRIVGFSGRKLNEDDWGGKYVNTGQTPLFHKGSAIFNFAESRRCIAQAKNVFVVEGQFDVFALKESGVPHVVAVSGTAVTTEHCRILSRAVGDEGRLTFCLDGDKAGKKAMASSIQKHDIVRDKGRAVVFSRGSDPCSIFQDSHFGAQAVRDYLTGEHLTSAKFLTKLCVLKKDPEDSEGVQKRLKRLAILCKDIKDPVFVRLCAHEMSRSVSMPEDDVISYIEKHQKSTSAPIKKEEDADNNYVPRNVAVRLGEAQAVSAARMYQKMLADPLRALELRIFAIVARYPGIVTTCEGFSTETFVSPALRTMTAHAIDPKTKSSTVIENYGKYALLSACVFFDSSLLGFFSTRESSGNVDQVREHLAFLVEQHASIVDYERERATEKEILSILSSPEAVSVDAAIALLKEAARESVQESARGDSTSLLSVSENTAREISALDVS